MALSPQARIISAFPEYADYSDERRLRWVVIQIGMISHAKTSAWGDRLAPDTSDDIGGRRPSGGMTDWPGRNATTEERMAFNESIFRRTPQYFQRRFEKCHTERALTELLADAEETYVAWRWMLIPAGQEPDGRTRPPLWKRYVAESNENAGDLARRFNVTRQYVYQIRSDYRTA